MTQSPAAPEHRPAALDENIDILLEVRRREQEQRSSPQRLIDRVGQIIGRIGYLLGVFGFALVWVLVNELAPRWGWSAFDPSPFALLDGLLTLAALLTTIVVLITQNRQTRIEQQHAHIALQVNLLTEQKVAKIISLLEELRRDLPMVKDRYDPQAETLAEKTDALHVLTAVEEVGLTQPPSEADAPLAAAAAAAERAKDRTR